MNEQVKEYIDKYPNNIIEMYNTLWKQIFDSVSSEPQETMWAKLPTYYVGESFVRLIPFKDHINIEAKAVLANTEMLSGYKVTPKGMLQIFLKQDIPADVLRKIFVETLGWKIAICWADENRFLFHQEGAIIRTVSVHCVCTPT